MTSIAQSPLDLNELLYHICTFVDCEDLKAFSATSRRIYTVAYPILEYHRIYWAKFQNLEDGPNASPWYWHKLSVSLLTSSLGAPYIRHIKTGSIDGRIEHASLSQHHNRALVKDWDIASESDRMIEPQLRGQLGRFRRLCGNAIFASTAMQSSDLTILKDYVKSCGWFSDHEKQELASDLRFRQPTSIRAILFPLLPNLNTLKIGWSSSSLQRHLGIAVRHAAIAYSLDSRWTSFSKLVEVDLTTDSQSSESLFSSAGGEYSLDFLSYFMALPKLKRLSARLVIADSFTRTKHLPPPSSLTNISLYDQDISPSAFRNLLADGSPLKSVKLRVLPNPRWFDDGKFVDILLEHSQSSLNHLEILRTSNITLNGPINGICLQSFTNLEYIAVSYESFQLQPNTRMAELLPTSLHKLELHTLTAQQRMPNEILYMLKNVSLFPSWIELCIYGWVSEEDKLRLTAACQQNEIGISIVSDRAINWND